MCSGLTLNLLLIAFKWDFSPVLKLLYTSLVHSLSHVPWRLFITVFSHSHFKLPAPLPHPHSTDDLAYSSDQKRMYTHSHHHIPPTSISPPVSEEPSMLPSELFKDKDLSPEIPYFTLSLLKQSLQATVMTLFFTSEKKISFVPFPLKLCHFSLLLSTIPLEGAVHTCFNISSSSTSVLSWTQSIGLLPPPTLLQLFLLVSPMTFIFAKPSDQLSFISHDLSAALDTNISPFPETFGSPGIQNTTLLIVFFLPHCFSSLKGPSWWLHNLQKLFHL